MLNAANSSISQKYEIQKYEIWCESPQSQYRYIVLVLILLVLFFKKMLCALHKTHLHRSPFHDIWFRGLSTSNSILRSEACQSTLQVTIGVVWTERLLFWTWRPSMDILLLPLQIHSPPFLPYMPWESSSLDCIAWFLLSGAYLVIQCYDQQTTEAGKRKGLGCLYPFPTGCFNSVCNHLSVSN